MKTCHACTLSIDDQLTACPHCGTKTSSYKGRGERGFEYKSQANLWGIPLLHISFKTINRKPVPAKGIIAIGQFAAGIVSVGQFGIGIFSLSQFAIAYKAIAQMAVAEYAIAQMAVAYDGMAQFGFFLKDFFLI